MIIVITVLGGLGLFLFGMSIMSDGLQKVAGKRLRATLGIMTTNRVAGAITGLGITSIIQSSSATTVMVVTFANAGLLTLTQSIGVIMGANIGTTVTGWLVALVGFKVKLALIAMLTIAIGFICKLYGKGKAPHWGDVLIGFGLIFVGLDFMKDAMGGLKGSVAITDWMAHFSANSLHTLIAAILVGAAVTMVIQSSSATMALTMTLAAQGMIDFPTAAALILGENIGTTITANLAAIGASRSAKRAALAHMFFNVMGVIWMLFVFKYFIQLTDWIVPGNSLNDNAIPSHMAAFHTIFNVLNTLIFLPFAPTLAWLVTKIIPKESKGVEKPHLKYIESGMMATPSLALETSRQELYRMSDGVNKIVSNIVETFKSPGLEFGSGAEEINQLEEQSDKQKELITVFLRNVLKNSTSSSQGTEVTRILSHISDLERIGDHGKNIYKLSNLIFETDIPLPLEAHQDLMALGDTLIQFMDLVFDGLRKPGTDILDQARTFEARTDELRTSGKEKQTKRLLDNTCDITSGMVFIDILIHFEKIGDHLFNMAQRVSGVR